MLKIFDWLFSICFSVGRGFIFLPNNFRCFPELRSGSFVVYFIIDELPDMLTSEFKLFADKFLVYNNKCNKHTMELDLIKLEKNFCKWQLSFNVSKCAVLSINNKNANIDYYHCGTRLSKTNSQLTIMTKFIVKQTEHLASFEGFSDRFRVFLL